MKISEIRKMNRKIVKNSEDFIFFKSLYQHCVSVIDEVPESFVNRILEQANRLRIPIQEICVYQNDDGVRIDFLGCSINTRENFEGSYLISDSTLDFKGVSVYFNFFNEKIIKFHNNNKEESWYNYDGQRIVFKPRFSPENLERLFGKNFLQHTNDSFYVLAKVFE